MTSKSKHYKDHINICLTLDKASAALCGVDSHYTGIDPDNEFETLLRAHAVITSDQLNRVYNKQANQTQSDRIKAIVGYIKLSHPSSYTAFRECLIKLKREDLVHDLLPPYFNEVGNRAKIYLEPFLVKRIECTYGLISSLLTNKVLAMSEAEEVKYLKILSEQNFHLLNTIAQKPEGRHQDDFLNSLEETCQSHLANYIRLQKAIACGNDPIDLGDDRPLNDFEVDKLAQRSHYLIRQLDLSRLWDILLKKKCFNEWHKEKIDLFIGQKLKMNEEFRFLLSHRSLMQYKIFRASLHVTDQSEVVDPLDVDGAITALVALLTTAEGKPVCKVVEKTIAIRHCHLIKTQIKPSRIPVRTNVSHISTVHDHSMRVYFLCLTLKSLRKIRELNDSDQLKAYVESYYNWLLAATEYPPIRVKILHFIDYSKCEKYFLHSNRNRDRAESFSERREALTDLPEEIWKQIVVKSFYFERMFLSNASDQEMVHCKLSSVCSAWHCVVNTAVQLKSCKHVRARIPISAISMSIDNISIERISTNKSVAIDTPEINNPNDCEPKFLKCQSTLEPIVIKVCLSLYGKLIKNGKSGTRNSIYTTLASVSTHFHKALRRKKKKKT